MTSSDSRGDGDTGTLIDYLTQDARHLLPGLEYAGNMEGGLSSVPDKMLHYVAALLQGIPSRPPEASGAEWRDLLNILLPHWVFPLLYYKIRSLPQEYAPPREILDYLRLAFLRSSARAAGVAVQLAEVVEAFRKEGVPVLVLKGPALAHGVYPHVGARPHSDLDLLVLPEKIVQARSILLNMGYSRWGKQYDFAKFFAHHENFTPPTSSPGYFEVEMHWDLTKVHWPGWEGRLKGLFDRAVTMETDTVTFETLSPVDALIHRSLNNAWVHYHDMRLIWINDVALLAGDLTAPEDWKVLQEQCDVWRCRLALETSLKLAQAWTGLRLPSGFDDFSTWPDAAEERGLWTTITSRHNRLGSYILLQLRLSAKERGLMRTILALLFPDPGLMRLYYPPAEGWRLPIAYVRRWWRWIRHQ
jgi:hypothetical protein